MDINTADGEEIFLSPCSNDYHATEGGHSQVFSTIMPYGRNCPTLQEPSNTLKADISRWIPKATLRWGYSATTWEGALWLRPLAHGVGVSMLMGSTLAGW
jgi:hypothetical protein